MEQVEQGLAGLTELIDRYGKEIRFISEEALDGDREPSAEEFRTRITGAQDRIYREALETYDRIVKAAQHGRALGRRRCPEAFKGHTGCRDRPPCLCPARIGHVADDIASGRIGHIDGVA